MLTYTPLSSIFFERRGLFDMIYLMGTYRMACGFSNYFEVPVPA